MAESASQMIPRVIDELGTRMKTYEAEANASYKLDPAKPYLARIDGHKFSTFTRGFRRPFDERIHGAMVQTTVDLVHKFHALTGYTQSDEITLVFPVHTAEQAPIFGGKVTKLSSVLSGYTSVRFAYYMSQYEFDSETEEHLQRRVSDPQMHFDARVFNVPNDGEALNNIIWRSLFDCRRNSVSALARSHMSSKQMHKLGTTALQQKLRDELGVDWNDMPLAFRDGTFVKRECYLKTALDRHSGEEVTTERTRVTCAALHLPRYSADAIAWLFAPRWCLLDGAVMEPSVGPATLNAAILAAAATDDTVEVTATTAAGGGGEVKCEEE